MKKLPIGKQDFASLIEDGYLYVDKTEQIFQLINSGPYLFLSRPRRFGKSLLISTLKEIFQAKRHLFKGLWIENKLAWASYPVVHIDFNQMDYRSVSLGEALNSALDNCAKTNGIQLSELHYKSKFSELLSTLGSNGKKAVVLIDEYDKPITDFLGEDETRIQEHVNTLKNFYSTLKSMDPYLHFVFIAGVSKYGRVSVFSDLNNMYDLTTDPAMAKISGWTQEELEANFGDYLKKTAAYMGIEMSILLEKIRFWYNGYSWDGKITLYNPFSLLNFFQAKRFNNFWFTTGTPSFLTRLLRLAQLPVYRFEYLSGSNALLESADVTSIDLDSLLFQTGYLTIKKIDATQPDRLKYFLSYPNEEVRASFLKYVLAEYVGKPVFQTESTYTEKIQESLERSDFPAFFSILHALFASIPYQITRTEESYFHSIVHVVLALTGYVIYSEIPTNQGRMNAVLETKTHICIFEFKTGGTPEQALAQIREKGYHERFRTAGKSLTLVGVVFDISNKNVGSWKVEEA